MPVYYATKSKGRAVCLGTLSGMSEPFGALLASFVANEDSSPAMFGGVFGLTVGKKYARWTNFLHGAAEVAHWPCAPPCAPCFEEVSRYRW